jgi:hypothetical protein
MATLRRRVSEDKTGKLLLVHLQVFLIARSEALSRVRTREPLAQAKTRGNPARFKI